MNAASPVRHERASEGKARLYAADGTFLMRATTAVADELLAAGLAEWRGRDLRMIAVGGRRGLNGLHVTRRETTDNARGCYSFTTRTMLMGGAR